MKFDNSWYIMVRNSVLVRGGFMFSDFIKHYDNIRCILRDIFLYGCFSREDLENKSSVSSRKVSYEIRRIQQYIEKEFIRSDWEGRNKLLSLSYDSISNTQNFLVGTYQSKSFTKTDLILHFYLLMALKKINKPATFLEIEDFLIQEGLISYDNISSKTVQRKLNELTNSLEILKYEKKGRSKAYSINDDILKELTNDELRKLIFVVSLYKNILFPTISGYYCEETLKDYMSHERGINEEYDDCFQYKNLHFHPLIDEEILWKFMKAIKNRNLISHSTSKAGRRLKSREVIKPFKLRYDVNCGRFYLISFNENGRCISSRLDRVEEVTIHKEKYDPTELQERYIECMKHSWSSVPCNNVDGHDTLILKVIIDESKEKYILEKIKNELGECTIDNVANEEYLIQKKVNDCSEMVPWLRSFSGNIKVISPKWLDKRLKDDWKEMLNNYGVIS
ncbi:WYL domain-containing protein [Oceanirhabdus sp. W0125-5]|uniref:WYL domain-containing protein n=1 Tax=Oceanirhabdus sp. W0125-5 TaxID=2999116 RepID=UPI0022F2A957|nr:WYL domain-containing protein [Oceanirhabdus sp. W0125-5]WBW98624.1 WYL domain-containing protein [Oceanirhabdus sp. W0125-5]